MEPMTLGSPLGSPSSPGTNQYLPPFLLGEQPSVLQAVPRGFSSSTPVHSQRRISTDINAIPSYLGTSPRSPQSRTDNNIRSISLHQPSEKPGGPPTQGLFESLTTAKTTPPSTLNTSLTPSLISTPTGTFGFNESCFQPRTPINTTAAVSWASPAPQRTPTTSAYNPFQQTMNASSSYILQPSRDSEPSDSCWVTVFGFPPAANTFIISQFSFFGTIVEHKISQSGNWVYLRYQTPHEARIALSKNGKVFGKYIMVGVSPCKEEDIIRLQSQKENLPETPEFVNTPGMFLTRPNTSFGYNLDNTRHLSEIQPLNFQTSIIPPSGNPKKSSSVMSKAMDLLFGW